MGRYIIRGDLKIARVRKGKRTVVFRGKGLFTRNMGSLIASILAPYVNRNFILNQETPKLTPIKNLDGYDINLAFKYINFIVSPPFYFSNLFTIVTSEDVIGLPPDSYLGAMCFLTSQSVTPTPEMYTLPSLDLRIDLDEAEVIGDETTTKYKLRGSKTIEQSLTVKGAGIAIEVKQFAFEQNPVLGVEQILLDVFTVAETTFSAGDTVVIEYWLTFA